MKWATVSYDENLDLVSGDVGDTRLSSAYLTIQYPLWNESDVLAACAVDARWIEGAILGRYESYNASVLAQGESWQESLARDSTRWRAVRLGRDWLNSLTPSFDASREGYTTLSSLLETIGVEKVPEDGRWWDLDRWAPVEAAVSTLVANGMAYTGYLENGGSASTLEDVESFLQIPQAEDDLNHLLFGTLDIPPPVVGNSSISTTTTMRWDLFMAGIAYDANSTGYWFALTVLFVHAIVALSHTLYSLWRQRTSSAWESFCESLTLALNSARTTELAPSSDRVSSLRRLEKAVFVREVESRADRNSPGMDGLQVVASKVSRSGLLYKEVQFNKEYKF